MLRCSFCGGNIDPELEGGFWLHDSGETRHKECGDEVAREEPGVWTYEESDGDDA